MAQEQAIGAAQAQPLATVITAVQDILEVRQTWVSGKAQELALVEAALKELQQAKAPEARIRRTQRRVQFLRKVVNALRAGYIPIPRFAVFGNAFSVEEMPLKAIIAVNEAQQQGVFDRIVAIAGHRAQRRGWGRVNHYDPIIVGIVDVPGLFETRTWNGHTNHVEIDPPHEEQFLIAWWRPEDLRPEEVF